MIMKKSLVLLLLGGFIFTGCSDDAASFKVIGSSSASSRLQLADFLPVPGRVPSGTPTSFKITLYSAYIATGADCSNPLLIQDYGSAGQEFDMMASPTLFSGTPAAGTYHCLILKFKDNMKFKADATAVANHAGCTDTTTEYTFDIYREAGDDDGDWIDLNGVGVDATGSAAAPGADTTFFFGSTSVSAAKANGVTAHTNQSGGLASPLVVPGQTTYYWDATNGIENHVERRANYCWVEEVTSGFR
jgi:hypothetical protein